MSIYGGDGGGQDPNAMWGGEPMSVSSFSSGSSQAQRVIRSIFDVRNIFLSGDRLQRDEYKLLSSAQKRSLRIVWDRNWAGRYEDPTARLQEINRFGRPQPGGGDRFREKDANGKSWGYNQIWTMPWRDATPEQFEDIQRTLYAAGFYPSDGAPRFGDRTDEATIQAWQSAVSSYYALGRTDQPLKEFLGERAQQFGDGGEPFQLDTHIAQLTDAAAIRSMGDAVGQAVLGRKLTDQEKAASVALIHGEEMAASQTAFDVQDQNQLAGLGLNVGTVAGTITPDVVGRTGASLAAQYGLTVTSHIRSEAHNEAIGGARNSDHLTGLGIDIAGNPQQMEALGQWAIANTGPGKLFRWVGWRGTDPSGGHNDHVHLSFNTHVGAGADMGSAMVAGTGSSASGVEAWMAATRQVESGGNYEVVNGIGARGAYQFMPGTWSGAARDAGANPNDWSAANQDRVARHLASRYYQQFGDWRLVSIAWHAGPGSAERAKLNPGYAASISDGNISTAGYADKVMAAMGSGGGASGLPGGNVVAIEGVDIQARLEEEMRRRFPGEAGAHDLAGTYDQFADLAFGGSTSSGIGLS